MIIIIIIIIQFLSNIYLSVYRRNSFDRDASNLPSKPELITAIPPKKNAKLNSGAKKANMRK